VRAVTSRRTARVSATPASSFGSTTGPLPLSFFVLAGVASSDFLLVLVDGTALVWGLRLTLAGGAAGGTFAPAFPVSVEAMPASAAVVHAAPSERARAAACSCKAAAADPLEPSVSS